MKLNLATLIALILAVAGSATATSAKWGINTGTLTSPAFDSGTLYLVYDASASTFSYSGGTAGQSSFSIGSVGGTVVASGALAADAYVNAVGVSLTPAGMGIAAGISSFYIVAISGDGHNIAWTPTDGSINIQTAALSQSYLVNGSTGFSYATAVPEPTSMALFGLGAGVMVLRRRFKSKKA